MSQSSTKNELSKEYPNFIKDYYFQVVSSAPNSIDRNEINDRMNQMYTEMTYTTYLEACKAINAIWIERADYIKDKKKSKLKEKNRKIRNPKGLTRFWEEKTKIYNKWARSQSVDAISLYNNRYSQIGNGAEGAEASHKIEAILGPIQFEAPSDNELLSYSLGEIDVLAKANEQLKIDREIEYLTPLNFVRSLLPKSTPPIIMELSDSEIKALPARPKGFFKYTSRTKLMRGLAIFFRVIFILSVLAIPLSIFVTQSDKNYSLEIAFLIVGVISLISMIVFQIYSSILKRKTNSLGLVTVKGKVVSRNNEAGLIDLQPFIALKYWQPASEQTATSRNITCPKCHGIGGFERPPKNPAKSENAFETEFVTCGYCRGKKWFWVNPIELISRYNGEIHNFNYKIAQLNETFREKINSVSRLIQETNVKISLWNERL